MNFFIEVVLLSIPKQSRRVNKQTNKQTATCLVFLFFFPPSFFRKPYYYIYHSTSSIFVFSCQSIGSIDWASLQNNSLEKSPDHLTPWRATKNQFVNFEGLLWWVRLYWDSPGFKYMSTILGFYCRYMIEWNISDLLSFHRSSIIVRIDATVISRWFYGDFSSMVIFLGWCQNE